MTALMVETFETTEQAVQQYPDANTVEQIPSVSFEDSLRRLFRVAPATRTGWTIRDDFYAGTQWFAVWERQPGSLSLRDLREIIALLRANNQHISIKHVAFQAPPASQLRLRELDNLFDGVVPLELLHAMDEALKADVGAVWIMPSPQDSFFSILVRKRKEGDED